MKYYVKFIDDDDDYCMDVESVWSADGEYERCIWECEEDTYDSEYYEWHRPKEYGVYTIPMLMEDPSVFERWQEITETEAFLIAI